MTLETLVAQLRRLLPPRFVRHEISESSALHVLILCRQIIEEPEEEEDWPALHFFCTWVAHPELNRHQRVTQILGDLSQVDFASDEESVDEAVSRSLGLAALRTELIGLVSKHGAGANLLESIAGWESFMVQAFKSFDGRPLVFRGRASNDPEPRVRRFELYSPPGVRVMWRCRMSDLTEHTGQLKNVEGNEDFRLVSRWVMRDGRRVAVIELPS